MNYSGTSYTWELLLPVKGWNRDLKLERVTKITAWKEMPDRMVFSRGTQPTHGDLAGKKPGK